MFLISLLGGMSRDVGRVVVVVGTGGGGLPDKEPAGLLLLPGPPMVGLGLSGFTVTIGLCVGLKDKGCPCGRWWWGLCGDGLGGEKTAGGVVLCGGDTGGLLLPPPPLNAVRGVRLRKADPLPPWPAARWVADDGGGGEPSDELADVFKVVDDETGEYGEYRFCFIRSAMMDVARPL